MSEKTEMLPSDTELLISEPNIAMTPDAVVMDDVDVCDVADEPEEMLDYSPIPEDYYNITVDQHFVDRQVYSYLKGYHWDEPERGMWSLWRVTQLEHELTNRGCNVKIRYADCKTRLWVDEDDMASVGSDDYERSCYQPELDQIHAWLMIEMDDVWVAYDAQFCYWAFEPDHPDKSWHWKGDKLYDHAYYKEDATWNWGSGSCTFHNFIDFDNISELWNYYQSNEMYERRSEEGLSGKWYDYWNSDDYNVTDDFLINFGWWITDDEFHEIETRINKATGWYGYGVDY